ncbi:MAG: hypothetical protein OXE79_08130 [Acidimicrobiaceae bacterium]|nr:hypothetical protein [Acidimicrobiaceae bacterium]MCY4294554.1 hypothetical protein [Acidimicrobiaceae bacterium]
MSRMAAAFCGLAAIRDRGGVRRFQASTGSSSTARAEGTCSTGRRSSSLIVVAVCSVGRFNRRFEVWMYCSVSRSTGFLAITQPLATLRS